MRSLTIHAHACAWCGRVSLGRGWIGRDGLRDYTTNGICPDCQTSLTHETGARPSIRHLDRERAR